MLDHLFRSVMIGVGAYFFSTYVGGFDNQSAIAYGGFIGAIIFFLNKPEEESEEENNDQP